MFKSRPVAIAAGVIALGVAWVALYDAYEGRGDKSPWPLRVVSWW
jgi:hypothetical protein